MKGTVFDLTGRTAVITGGSRGLGKSMARLFAQAGADLVISSRSEDELKSAQKEIVAGTNARCEVLTVDQSDRKSTEDFAAKTLKKMGKVDILINNAGHNLPQEIDAVEDAQWDRLIELNLTSCMALSRAFAPGMKERRWGRIIHVSSVMALASKEGRAAYSATKAALIGMTKAMAFDLGAFTITVNCIAPGPFLTDLPGKMLTDAQKKTFADRTALGRWGKPDEIAGPTLLLASEAGSYITGSVLIVDGGMLSKAF